MNDKSRMRPSERGIALITALMVTTMMLALGMAVVMSVTTDTSTTRSQRLGEQAFLAADGGLAITRKALATALQEELDSIRNNTAGNVGFWKFNVPVGTYQVIPDPVTAPNSQFFVNVRARALALTQNAARNTILSNLNGGSFTVASITLAGGFVTKVASPLVSGSPEDAVLRYTIVVDGTTANGANASVTETSRLATRTVLNNAVVVVPIPRSFKFSGFGAFFDHGTTASGGVLAAGTFSGPVHSNTHFAFSPSNLVTFTNVISQVDDQIVYNGGNQNRPSADTSWIDLPTSGYERKAAVPLPANNFSQEYAVINGTGITAKNADGTPVDPPTVNVTTVLDANGKVTKEALQANLRGVASSAGASTAFNATPTFNGAALSNGVYIAATSTGSPVVNTITGAGIYVQGDASDIQLIVGSNGTDQKYVITAAGSSVVTTITVSPTANTTTVVRGTAAAVVYTGVPTDKSNPASPTGGTSLFVNGSINSLRGGTTSSTNVPALASATMLTVTAQRDITVTGDLKYTSAVADPATGVPVANNNLIKNVLGLFTNDGNVNMAPVDANTSATGLGLQMDAAVVSFNSNTSNDSGRTDGSIVYTGATSPGANDKWTLIGSRVQSNINNIGFPKRNIFFDTRFDGGKFSPPFWPGTDYTLGSTSTVAGVAFISTVTAPTASGVSWYRKSR